ncbi:MAG: GNAT family N-acetyltransferase [Candidatus Pacebacteria bacterium]|nr:GNAT family N-acetyltransferase [Candidatus Paceibacterota bacterium]
MNIEIKKYTPETILPELIDLLNRKYGSHKNFDYFIKDYNAAFTFCVKNRNIQFEPIAVYSNGELRAYAAIIKDNRLKDGEVFFGFFESSNEPEIFNLLWNELKILAKKLGASLIKGPINGSIWHQYRTVKESNGSTFFKSEVISETYYYDFLRSRKPKLVIDYYSAYREKFSAIINAGKPSYEKLSDYGFSIQVAKNASETDLQQIASLSRKIFNANWGFTDLSDEEFLQLYSAEKLESHLSKLYLLRKGSDIVGFSNILKGDESTLIFKTIGVLPEYHRLGLGNALAFKAHLDAERDGIKKMIYALIKEDNNIKNFPKDDAVIFRKYSAFEFKI